MLKSLVKSTLRSLGLEVRRYQPPAPNRLEVFFQAWKQNAPAPRFIVDVGANRGGWSRTALSFFPDAQLLMIEPQERLKEYSADLLARPQVRWKTVGISDTIGTLKLTLPPRDDSASFAITDEEAKKGGFPQVEVPVLTLNELLRDEPRLPDILKIDAEGFDLRALAGASEVLGKVDVLLVECAVCCPFENTIEKMVALMGEAGYQLFDITDLNRSPKHKVLWLSEVVFVRKGAAVWQKLDRYE